jgi:hypothetical protein
VIVGHDPVRAGRVKVAVDLGQEGLSVVETTPAEVMVRLVPPGRHP